MFGKLQLFLLSTVLDCSISLQEATVSLTPISINTFQDEWSGIAYEVGEEDYWAWLIFIIFIVMSAFVVVNLIIAVICDALQILRKAERAMLFGLSEEEAGDGTRAPPKDEKVENNHTQEERIQQRIIDMNRMLDEVVASQERMSRTIQYLSIVVESQQTKTSTVRAR